MQRIGTTARAFAAVAAIALSLAACGHGSTNPAPATTTAGAVPGATTASTSVGTDKVKQLGTVLDAQGLTLYHNTQETNGKIVCTGSCASTWPPVAVTGSLPSAPAGTQGTFGTVTRPDGTEQLTFDGMPLYTYAGDAGPGQATGQGIGGIWFAVGPTGSIETKSGGASGGSSSGNGW
ncbi:MAG: hypothetical protein HY240_00045 [Actinobacteria bacterium]|nr:hypothetical protein [Actinomycetota bacterium]